MNDTLLEEKEKAQLADEATRQEEIDLILKRAKENSWEIFKQKEKGNFHIVTKGNIMLQRVDYMDYKNHQVQYWSIVKRDKKRLKGKFLAIMQAFVKEYTSVEKENHKDD